MQVEAPRPNSISNNVWEHLKQGKTRLEIHQLTGFALRSISRAIATLTDLGLYHQTPEQIERERRELISFSMGGSWLEVKKYAYLRMFPREIHAAILLERNKDVPLERIHGALSKAVLRGYLAKRTPEEQERVWRNTHRPLSEIRDGVIKQLEQFNEGLQRAQGILLERRQILPSSEVHQVMLYRFWKARGVYAKDAEPMSAFQADLDCLPDIDQAEIDPYIKIIISATPIERSIPNIPNPHSQPTMGELGW